MPPLFDFFWCLSYRHKYVDISGALSSLKVRRLLRIRINCFRFLSFLLQVKKASKKPCRFQKNSYYFYNSCDLYFHKLLIAIWRPFNDSFSIIHFQIFSPSLIHYRKRIIEVILWFYTVLRGSENV